MTDLEITKRCAEKMGVDVVPAHETVRLEGGWMIDNGHEVYEPLFDDAQAMALVKKFDLEIDAPVENIRVVTAWDGKKCISEAASADLNRAICECVAQLPD